MEKIFSLTNTSRKKRRYQEPETFKTDGVMVPTPENDICANMQTDRND